MIRCLHVPGRSRGSRHSIPWPVKLAVGGFVSVLVPVYWHVYGWTNFLWFCDFALLLATAGIWIDNPLLISVAAVGILVPQGFWLVDLGSHLAGFHFLDLTSYMFDPRLSWFIRGLSLFHGWLPLLLVWLVFRVGYDSRALIFWTMLAAGLVVASYGFGLPAGAHPANPNTPVNLNMIYGFDDRHPQAWLNQNLYVPLWFGGLWLCFWLPTHLVLRKCFARTRATLAWKPCLRLL